MRKTRIRKVLLTAVMSGTLLLMGCSTAWIAQAEQIVTALIPAVANVVTLVTAARGNISTADLQTVQSVGAQAGADLQLIQSLITRYQKADAGAQPEMLNQIQAAMGAVQATLNGLQPALHIKDAATQAKITAVVGILLSEVESMAAIVPLTTAKASPRMMALALRQGNIQGMSAWEFVASYNAAMTAKTENAALDHATAGLRIHSHGRLARWASGFRSRTEER